MDRRSDAGVEFVLDNRKLILTFFILIAVCGAFFVIGFMEGKRQTVNRAVSNPASVPEPAVPAEQAGSAEKSAGGAASKPLEERSVRDQLDWYKRVNKAADATRGLEPLPEPAKPMVQPADPQPATPRAASPMLRPPATTTAGTYSVQVGAFRQRREIDAKAALLKAKGYDCIIENPATEGQLYLLKVGRYSSRAEAHSMQLRLKRDGFTSFIKTNP
jgi:cell division protein FtsN